MKLAEALQERADLVRKIGELRGRLDDNATVQEGENPAEDPSVLLSDLRVAIARLERLTASVNLTNTHTLLDGKTLTEQLAKRDALRLQIESLREVIAEGSRLAKRASHTEIRILSAVDVPVLQKEADTLSAELRKLDNRIQETNWTTEMAL